MTHGKQTRLTLLIASVTLAAAPAMAQEAAAADRTPDLATGQQRIIISIPDRKLALLETSADGSERLVRLYDVAVGKPSTPSPEGEFRIVSRISHPTWYTTGRVVPPGRSNPLGTRWMGLSKPGYGIHGTNVPLSIGSAASHGCIRMRNHDVEELFELVAPGIVVQLAGERPTAFNRLVQIAD